MIRAALLVVAFAFVACDNTANTVPPEPAGPTSTTEFRISVMNACATDVLVKLADSATAPGREQVLLKNQRDTITGTKEQVYLMSGSEVAASYRPKQGSQKVTISSDCSAISPD
jgi:hypothetical protein